MFKTNSRFSQRPKTKVYYRPGSLIPVLSAEKLLGTSGLRALMQEIESHIQIPSAYFEVLYLQVIHRFTEMVQLLPLEEDGVLAGLLNRSIARACLLLRQFNNQNEKEQDPLVAYALFTSALLLDLGKILHHFSVTLVLEDDDTNVEWQPFSGSMVFAKAKYYKLLPKTLNKLGLDQETTALLARQILPSEGFFWLYSDPSVFYEWLLILRGAPIEDLGRLSLIFSLLKHDELLAMVALLEQPIFELAEDQQVEEAELFLAWLKDGIDSGSLKVNQNGIHYFEGELFIESSFFQYYVESQRQSVLVDQLRNQVEKLFKSYQSQVTSKDVSIKRSVNHSEFGKKLEKINRINTLGFLNIKKTMSNPVVVPAKLVLKSAMIEANQIHALPNLSEKKVGKTESTICTKGH